MVLIANDDNIDELEDHRETPDHRDRRKQDVVHDSRQVGRIRARDNVGNDHVDRDGEHRHDNALHEYSYPRHAGGVHFAHHRRQAAIQAGDKEQAAKRIVVDDRGIEAKADHD